MIKFVFLLCIYFHNILDGAEELSGLNLQLRNLEDGLAEALSGKLNCTSLPNGSWYA